MRTAVSSWAGEILIDHAHYLLGDPTNETPVDDDSDRTGGALIGTLGDAERVHLTIRLAGRGAADQQLEDHGGAAVRFRVRFDEPADVTTWDYGPTSPATYGLFPPGDWTFTLHRRPADRSRGTHEEVVEDHLLLATPNDPGQTLHLLPEGSDADWQDDEGYAVRLSPAPGRHRLVLPDQTHPARGARDKRISISGHVIDLNHDGAGTWYLMVEPDSTPMPSASRWTNVVNHTHLTGPVRLLGPDGHPAPGLPDPVADGTWTLTVAVLNTAAVDPLDIDAFDQLQIQLARG